MLLDNTLEIYPTSRAVREQNLRSLAHNTLLPPRITIGEFEKKALLVPGRTFVDEERRVLLMQEAADFDNFRKLRIDREFFTFLKNSSYLFAFFEELAMEHVTIEDLRQSDTYAEYGEHLEILSTLRQNYLRLLDRHRLVDRMTLPEVAKINTRYIGTFDRIELHLEGYLNRFEIKLFEEIATRLPVIIHYHTTPFNRKMTEIFHDLGFTLPENHTCQLDLGERRLLSARPHTDPDPHYRVCAVENAPEEVAFIKKAVYDFIRRGYPPEEIVVLLPRPALAPLLDLFDDENNFNFAMGFPFTEDPVYKRLDALYRYYTQKSYENRYRLQTMGFTLEEVHSLQQKWGSRLGVGETRELLATLVPPSQSDGYALYEEQLHLFGALLPAIAPHYPFHKVLHLFLNRLAAATLDDTRGGKITVMEILETRGITKKAVIVADFNEGVLPNRSRKDLFLSSAIRTHAGLPTPQDRQNLQKYYYQRFFSQAEEVAICYIEDEQNRPSRFLKELHITAPAEKLPWLRSILFPKADARPHYLQESLVLPYDFTKIPLSASALRTFLECRRRYYFAYIRKLGEFEIPKEGNDERLIGTLLHEALHEVYAKSPVYEEPEMLRTALREALYRRSDPGSSLRLLVDIWLRKMDAFIGNEIERFHKGARVEAVERKFTRPLGALTLTGTADRIDTVNGERVILDYKSGKIPTVSQRSLEKATDFQLQFYTLLAEEEAPVAEALYYDLGSGALVAEPLFEEKMALLHEHLARLASQKRFDFTMTEERQKCLWCPYQKICDRIL